MIDANNNIGHYNTGHRDTGDSNTGWRNTGNWNAGGRNTGHQNTGHYNTGNYNTGNWNAGGRNTGHQNTGHYNTGDHNTGDYNTGWYNTGNWNAGNQNTGFFNTETPIELLVFGKPCNRDVWNDSYKPGFLYFDLTCWINKDDMTEQEKKDNPEYHTLGGFLRIKDYKEAFIESWDDAEHDDKIKIKDLPNFNNEMFKEISGIDVNEYLRKHNKSEIIEINGKKYKRIEE